MTENQNSKKSKLILVDGYSFVFRAYHALSRANISRKDGTPVGAVFAFTNMLIKTINSHEFDHIAVIFDAGQKTFRNDIYKEYKANRPPAPDDLVVQFPIVREAVESMNIDVVEKIGVEADDIIATYTEQAKSLGMEVVIFSSDKDLMQLIDENVIMYDSIKFKNIGIEEVKKKFGVEPKKVLDVLSLMGDSADNIPGVPSIGPKTATELINKYGNLESIFENLEDIKQNKRRQALADNYDKAMMSKELVTLKYDVDLEKSVTDLTAKPLEKDNFVKFLKEQNFKSLLVKYSYIDSNTTEDIPAKSEAKIVSIETVKFTKAIEINNWLKNLGEIRRLIIHTEIDAKKGHKHAVSFFCNNQSCFIDLSETDNQPKESQTNLFDEVENAPKLSLFDEIIIGLKEILEDKSIIKIAHNIKLIEKICINNDMNLHNFDDIMMMSYSSACGLYDSSLELVVENNCDIDVTGYFNNNFTTLSDDQKLKYIGAKSNLIYLSYKSLKKKLISAKAFTIYEKLEKPLINVIAQMEVNGISLDKKILQKLSSDFKEISQQIEKEIHQMADEEFNVGSPKQLGDILFGKLGLPKGKKSKKTGAYSTDVKVLQSLADEGYEIVGKVLKWRHISKITSTYTDALQKQIEKDGRVRTNYEMAVTNTGRLSSKDPNLQNIPIRSEEGNKIRSAFVAKKGYDLIAADYSQIELRLLAEIADIEVLKEALKNKVDIHAVTASQMFEVDIDDVSTDQRRQAKTINFGIIYGISGFGLAQRLGIERKKASEYIKQYFEKYPGIKEYMERTVGYAKENGYVKTLFGRKCYIKGIKDGNTMMRQFSERAAINAPLQGSAADIIKRAMINLSAKLTENNSDSKILLQVHDELVIESPESQTEKTMQLIKQEMENAVTLSVPLTVDCQSGKSWLEIH